MAPFADSSSSHSSRPSFGNRRSFSEIIIFLGSSHFPLTPNIFPLLPTAVDPLPTPVVFFLHHKRFLIPLRKQSRLFMKGIHIFPVHQSRFSVLLNLCRLSAVCVYVEWLSFFFVLFLFSHCSLSRPSYCALVPLYYFYTMLFGGILNSSFPCFPCSCFSIIRHLQYSCWVVLIAVFLFVSVILFPLFIFMLRLPFLGTCSHPVLGFLSSGIWYFHHMILVINIYLLSKSFVQLPSFQAFCASSAKNLPFSKHIAC